MPEKARFQKIPEHNLTIIVYGEEASVEALVSALQEEAARIAVRFVDNLPPNQLSPDTTKAGLTGAWTSSSSTAPVRDAGVLFDPANHEHEYRRMTNLGGEYIGDICRCGESRKDEPTKNPDVEPADDPFADW